MTSPATPPLRDRTSMRAVLVAAPAVAALIVAIAIAIAAWLAHPPTNQLIARYEERADHALAIGDFETARLAAQRLIQLQPGEPMHHERLALAIAGGGSR